MRAALAAGLEALEALQHTTAASVSDLAACDQAVTAAAIDPQINEIKGEALVQQLECIARASQALKGVLHCLT